MKGINSFDENGYWSRYSNDNWSVCKIYDDVLGYKYTLSGESFDALEVVDKLASLESQLADAQARLAGYEVGYDPKVKLPEPLTIEWRGYPVFVVIDVNGYTHICDAYSKEYGFRATQGERVQFYSVDKVLRWFPLPDAKEEE